MPTTPRTIHVPSADTAPRRPRRTRNVVLLGLATLAVAGVGVAALDRPAPGTTTFASVADVRAVVIDIDNGPVRVVGGPGRDVGIRTTLHGSAVGTPVGGHELVAGVLTISAGCQGITFNCYVDEDVTVPAGVPVRVHTTAGTVDGVRLDVPRFEVTTTAGSVSASFVSPPQDVRVETSAGSVEVRVPDVGYRVRAEAAAGSEQVDIVQDPSAARSLSISTAAGSITVGRS